jgi:hypothetical protein
MRADAARLTMSAGPVRRMEKSLNRKSHCSLQYPQIWPIALNQFLHDAKFPFHRKRNRMYLISPRKVHFRLARADRSDFEVSQIAR